MNARLNLVLQRGVVLVAVISAFAATAPVSRPAPTHAGGAWMFQWEVQERMEARGFNLPICTGKGAFRYPPNAPPNRNRFLYRHFQCLVTDTRQIPIAVRCVHSLTGKRLSVGVSRPPNAVCKF